MNKSITISTMRTCKMMMMMMVKSITSSTKIRAKIPTILLGSSSIRCNECNEALIVQTSKKKNYF